MSNFNLTIEEIAELIMFGTVTVTDDLLNRLFSESSLESCTSSSLDSRIIHHNLV